MRVTWLSLFSVRSPALLRHALAAGLGALCLSGCMTWRRSAERPAERLARQPKMAVRVNLHDGRRMVLRDAFVRGDSLGGREDLGAGTSQDALVALQDVVSTEVSRLDVGRSVLMAAAIGTTAVLLVNAANSPPGNNQPAPPPPSTSSDCGVMGCGSFSCPLVYSWEGRHWRLDSGTFGGAIVEALQRTDVDNLDYSTAHDGIVRLRVTNELAETDHLDALAVLAVDHDASVSVAPDPSGRIHTIGALIPPVSAADFRGGDALARVRDADGWNWESRLSARDPARAADLRDGLDLVFVRPRGALRAHLVLDGNSTAWGTYMLSEFVKAHGRATQAWYDEMNARPAVARLLQARLAREAFLSAAVRTASGWAPQGTFWEAGPEVVKRQVLDLDLARVEGDTVRVRLESAPSFWTIDRVALDFSAERDVVVHELPLVSARDRKGRDIAQLIGSIDHRYYVAPTGAAADVSFSVPPLNPGQRRSFLLRSTGWYRVNSPEEGEPDLASLAALGRDSLGVGRASVARLNAGLLQLTERAR